MEIIKSFMLLLSFCQCGFTLGSSSSNPKSKCIRLDKPNATLPQIVRQPESLEVLLARGIAQLRFEEHNKTAIFVLGNTGSGKTTMTQIVNGNLSQLHMVQTHRRQPVIIDDNNRIGLPTTTSKTLVPEYVVNPENNVSFYDCPGFDDSRGEESDIAAMYFVNSITENVKQAKFLFVLLHSSTVMGNDRLDFDLLAVHASKFLLNMEKFSDSIGLIVTKVNSYASGYEMDDEDILGGIVEFLEQFHRDLKRNSEKPGIEASQHALLQRKIQFVEALLKQDEDGNYTKIWFIKNPIPPHCGLLSESPYYAQVRREITDLYMNKLQYSPVVPEDFGFTLKAETSLKIANDLIPAILEESKNKMEQVIDNLTVSYKTEIESEFNSGEDGKKSALLKINRVYRKINTFVPKNNQSADIRQVFELLESDVPNSYLAETVELEKQLKFYERVTMAKVNRPSINSSLSKLQNLARETREKSWQFIRNTSIPQIISQMGAITATLLNPLENVYLTNFYKDLNRLTMKEKTATVKVHHEQLKQLETKWRNSSSEYGSSSSITIASEINEIYFTLGYTVPAEQMNALGKLEKSLDFFGNAMESEVKRPIEEWLRLADGFIRKLENLSEWYEFLVRTDTELQRYQTQKEINEKRASTLVSSSSDALQQLRNLRPFLITSIIEQIHRSNTNQEDNSFLVKIVQNAFSEIKVECIEQGKKVVVKGSFVKVTDFIPIPCHSGSLREIEVFASEVLYFDTEIIFKRKEESKVIIKVVAKRWEIVGKNKKIDLSGSDGEKYTSSGESGTSPSANGRHGLSGRVGGNGGNFYGIYESIVNGKELTINLNAGNGGGGQNGGSGANGVKGRDATYDDFPSANIGITKLATWGFESAEAGAVTGFYNQVWWVMGGKPGTKGGNGGNGGKAGQPGYPGYIEIFGVNNGVPQHNVIKVNRNAGAQGTIGKGGAGGKAGKKGNQYGCQHRFVILAAGWVDCSTWSQNIFAENGQKGNDGGSTDRPSMPIQPTSVSAGSIWRNRIPAFKMFVLESRNEIGRDFVRKLDKNLERNLAFVSVNSLQEELINLESLFYRQPFPQEEMFGEYEDLLGRCENFNLTTSIFSSRTSTSTSSSDLRALNILYVTILSKIMALREQQSGSTMVVNVADYFKAVSEEIRRLKDARTDFVIAERNNNFHFRVNAKIEEAQSFVSSDVLPALRQLDIDLNQKSDDAITELEALHETALEAKKYLQVEERLLSASLLEKKIFEGLSLIGSVASLFGPIGSGISTAINAGISQSSNLENHPIIGSSAALQQKLRTFMERNHDDFMRNKNESIPFIIQATQQLISQHATLLRDVSSKLSDLRGAYAQLKNISASHSSSEPIHPENILLRHQQFEVSFNKLQDTILSKKQSLGRNETGLVSQLEHLANILTIADTNYELIKILQNNSSENAKDISPKMEKLCEIIRNIEKRKQAIYENFIPTLKFTMATLYQQSGTLAGSSSAALGVRKWKVKSMLKDIKISFKGLVAGLKLEEETLLIVDKIEEAFTMLTELYDQIEKYEESKQLADYISGVSTSFSRQTSSHIRGSTSKMRFYTKANLFQYQYEMAIAAFKQWSFPYASKYLFNDLCVFDGLASLVKDEDLEGVVMSYVQKVEDLANHLQKYKAMIVDGDDILFKSYFSSKFVSSRPFYLWENDEWQHSIRKLLTGEPIHLHADVWNSDWRKSAVKFRSIELHLKAPNDTMQRELDEKLKYYHVKMIHSGVSHYKFLSEVYVMKGNNVTLEYSFERREDTTSVSVNGVTDKFNSVGDYLLSPFTYWTFQLIDSRENSKDFTQLSRFAPVINLELQGEGLYIDEGRADKNKLLKLNVNEQYNNAKSTSGNNAKISSLTVTGPPKINQSKLNLKL